MANKKGQMGTLLSLVVGIGIITLVLIMLGSLEGTVFNEVESDLNLIGNTNSTETHTMTLNETVTLGHGFVQTDTFVFDDTSNTTALSLAQFNNLTNVTGKYSFTVNNTLFSGATLQVSYIWGDHNVRETVQGAILEGFNTNETTASYLPIVVLALIIAIVLGLVLTYAFIGGGSQGGMAL